MTGGCFHPACIIDCTEVQTGRTPVCGTDHETYESLCDLEQTNYCSKPKRKDIFLQYYTLFTLITFRHTQFYVLLTVHLGIIFVNNQLDSQFYFMYVYFYSLHVLGSHVPIIRRINCINMSLCIDDRLVCSSWKRIVRQIGYLQILFTETCYYVINSTHQISSWKANGFLGVQKIPSIF